MSVPSMSIESIDWIAIVATASGFLLGLMGLYLTLRSRSASMRDQLHRAQLDLLLNIASSGFKTMTACKSVCLSNHEDDRSSNRQKAWQEATVLMELSFRAMAILPAETAKELNLWAAIAMGMTMGRHPQDRDDRFIDTIGEYQWRFFQQARKDLRIDALADEVRTMLRDQSPEVLFTKKA